MGGARTGPGAWEESLGARCGPRELGLGLVVSLAGFAVSAAYVALVKGAFGVDESRATDEFSRPLGLLHGYLRHRTGSLWPGIVAHALHNMLSLVW